DGRSRLGGSRAFRREARRLKLDLVSHDPVVLPEAVLLVYPAGGGVDVFCDDVHHGESVIAGLVDCRSDEPRPESPAVVVGIDVELIELRPPLHTRIEPGGLERGTPEDESGDTVIGNRHGHSAATELHRIVHEEVRVDVADTRGVVKSEGLSLAREAFRRVMSRTYHLPCPAHGSLCGKTLRLGRVVVRFVAPVECVDAELVVPDHLARLDGVSIVELLAAAALG